MSGQPPSGYPTTGEIIDGKYQIERMLGEGGMGAVAKAIHLLLRAPVALKFMNPQYVSFPGAVERFLNEGVASKAIKSEHVVQVSDVGKLPSGAPYLVMDCLDGRDLSELLTQEGKPGLEIERVIHFMSQILRGLQVAHALGIIHRDMKPSNCFVIRHEGQADFVKILDFGISKVASQGSASLTQTNSALGTPLYMSPEQARSPRDVDARSDIYSVGVIFYELLTGHTPFTSDTGEFTEILFKLFTADVPPIQEAREDISPELAVVVHKALAREVADRYQSVGELAEALVPFASARTLPVLDRIKHYQPESRSSIVPRPENGPSSTFAFSALGQHTKPYVATPAASDTQATPTEATAKTQASYPGLGENVPKATHVMQQQLSRPPGVQQSPQDSPPEQAGVRTNLAVVRDTNEPELQVHTPRRSPLIYALVPIALVVVVGGVFGLKALTGDHARPDPSNTGNATGLVMTSTLPLPSASVIPTGTPSVAVPENNSVVVKDAGSAATAAVSVAKPPQNPGQNVAPGGSVKPGNTTPNTAHPSILENEVPR